MKGSILAAGAPADQVVAKCGDEMARTVLAARQTAAPELLFFLANDPAATVRVAVAANSSTPPLADRLLASDADPRVRRVLARKIAAMAPGLSPDAQDRLGRQAWITLSILISDEAESVRAAISEVVADMADAPRTLVLALARDAAMPVAEPILQLSALLTDDDLLALIAEPPVLATLTAIARRPGLSELLSDAIVGTARDPAIAALLANPSARIREATLDTLIHRAADHSDWHASLVRRPDLPPRIVRALSMIVTTELLRSLAHRSGLSADLVDELRFRLEERNDAGAGSNETAFLRAAMRGDGPECAELLARHTGLSMRSVDRELRMRNTKAIVSLCWQAGWSPTTAAAVQSRLTEELPGGAGRNGDEWPLGLEEMRWQIELLRSY